MHGRRYTRALKSRLKRRNNSMSEGRAQDNEVIDHREERVLLSIRMRVPQNEYACCSRNH